MRSHSWINSAKFIIGSYDGSMPLSTWMKHYFRENKRMGSRDRKEISHICYCFYRLGFSFEHLMIEDRILTGLFLSSTHPNQVLEELRPEWNRNAGMPPDEKARLVQGEHEVEKLFPFTEEVSAEIDQSEFTRSFFIQPDVFLRIRPNHQLLIRQKLTAAGVAFTEISADCMAVPASTKVNDVLMIDKEAVIQDLNSQQTINPVEAVFRSDEKFDAWDCCAASGGKSILFHDHFPKAAIFASDLRPAIIYNLQKRFERAGIKGVQSAVLNAAIALPKRKFELVICDAPCSGSGTWSRTPEQLHFCTVEKIVHYASLQKSIVENASKALRPGGYFLYITCSVFRKENEDVVNYIKEKNLLQLVSSSYLKGYDKKADTLFVALFRGL